MDANPLPGTEEHHRNELDLVYRLADRIQRARHVEQVYQEAVDGLRDLLQFDHVALQVQEGGEMRLKAWAALSPRARAGLEGFAPWPPEGGSPSPVVVDDVRTSAYVEPIRPALREEGVGSLACIPLLYRGRLMGELLLLQDDEGDFRDRDLRLARAMAGQLAASTWRSRSEGEQAELLRRFEAERSVLESVVRQMPAGVLLADVPSGRIIMSNAQVAELWDDRLRGATGVADYGLWDGRDDRGRPLRAEAWPLARSVLHGETVQGEEIHVTRRDGTPAVIRMSASPVVDGQGRQLAAVATIFDVTRERDAEARKAFLEEATRVLNRSLKLEETLGALAELVVGTYADWCMIYRRHDDERVERVTVVHDDPRLADRVRRLAAGPVAVESDHPVARAMRERRPLRYERVTADALRWAVAGDEAMRAMAEELRPTSALVLPLGARETALGAVVLLRTGGQYEAADEELLAELARRAGLALDNALLYEQATSADRAKANFLAVMSHEFRTPLSAILGYADILTAEIHGELNPMQRRHLDRVKASVRHLSHLVDEILSYASMEAGRERVRPESVELVALAADVAGIMEPIAEAAGLELRVRLPESPIPARLDPSKVRQILINLLSNAIKYTPEGRVELELEAGPEPGHAACRVTDTGLGIAPDHVASVFEPFWQVDQGHSRRISGTGLGLAVARRLARLMGGDVWLASQLGGGSTFTLDLPLEVPETVADGPAS